MNKKIKTIRYIMVKVVMMFIIGFSITLIDKIGILFIIPWTISWVIYDFNLENKKNGE